MTHAIISLLSIAMILAGTLALAGTSCSAVDLVFSSWQGMAESTGQMARTRISRPADDDDVGTQGSHVKVVLENTGQAGVADFSRWDIIVQYYGTDNSYYIKRLPYSAGPPGDNQWAMTGIFQDTQTLKPDVFEPGILNIAEQTWLHLKLNPEMGATSTSWAIIATPNGVTTSVIFKVLSPILYVADKDDQIVYQYWSDGTFLRTGPPDSQNEDASGITTDYTNFWTGDKEDDVYQYSAGFALLMSWAQTAANKDAEGITTDGNNIWVVDKKDNVVYKYTMAGSFDSSFSLAGANGDATGITTDGNNIWVVDKKDNLVYKYTMAGSFDSSFSLAGANGDATGITTDGNNIWVVDKDEDKVYKYTMAGSFDSSFSLAAANNDPQGITVTPR